MRRWIRDHSLSLFFLIIFLAALVGQAIAGHILHNEEAMAHNEETISLWRYIRSSDFGNAVMENWQSEYLQFMLFMLATVWLIHRGSPESKQPEEAGRESDQRQKVGAHAQSDSPEWAKAGGFKTAIYSNSLLIVMAIIFFGSWFAQSVTGWTEFNAQQVDHQEATLLVELHRLRRLLGGDPPELAIGVSGGGLVRSDHRLPAAARLAGVEAGGGAPRRHRRRGVAPRAIVSQLCRRAGGSRA